MCLKPYVLMLPIVVIVILKSTDANVLLILTKLTLFMFKNRQICLSHFSKHVTFLRNMFK